MATKEDFLNKIAKSLGRERRSNVKPRTYTENPWDHLYQDFSQEDYIQHFIQNLTLLGGNAVRVRNENELAETITGIVQKEEGKKAIIWKDDRLSKLSLQHHLSENKVVTKEWLLEESKQELIDFAEKADLGFTFADLGLAETGTVLLYNQAEKGRSVSLLPRVYVTFVNSKDIKPRITSALQHIQKKHQTEGLPSLINFITGPSRSADIEMSLSIGVHGPGIIYVIVLDY